MNAPDPDHILYERGVMHTHARKSRQVLEENTDVSWLHGCEQLARFPKTHPHGGIAFILGKRGYGKTQMAACAMRQLITCEPDEFMDPVTRLKWSVRYISAVDLYMRFRDAIKQGREFKTLREFTDPRMLVIDDIHEQAGTDHENRTLTRLLDARLGAERYTVLITNAEREELAGTVGESIASRFQESGMVIEVAGRNFRVEGVSS